MIRLQSRTDLLGAILATVGHVPSVIESGKFHRFGPGKSCWVKLFPDEMGAIFGDFRQGISCHWNAREFSSPAEKAAMNRQMRQAIHEHQRAQRIQHMKNAEYNTRLWAASSPAGNAVRAYLAERSLDDWPIPPCIREHPALEYYHTYDNGMVQVLGYFPAMLAPIVRNGNLLAIHRTYLTDGKKAAVPTPKKLTAASDSLAGACIPLAAPRGGVLGIAEGIETAIAASLGSGLPIVAAYCASALASFHYPADVERLLIFADHDPAGQKAAAALAQRAEKAGLKSKTFMPSRPGSDWADVWKEGRK